MILCWATFIALLGHLQPMGYGLDTPVLKSPQSQHTPTHLMFLSPQNLGPFQIPTPLREWNLESCLCKKQKPVRHL